MSPRIAHVSPIMPAAGGNGLAMRTGMFSQAAEQAGELLVVVVGPEAGTGVPDRLLRPETDVVRIDEGMDSRLLLITKSTPASSRPDLLTEYGRPLMSMPLSAATVAKVVRHLSDFRPDLIVVSRAYMLPILDTFDGALAEVPVLVDLDDDDGKLCRSLADHQHGAGQEDRAMWLQAQADVYDAVIKAHAGAARLFTAASVKVAGSIKERLRISPVTCVPNGVDGADAEPAGFRGRRAGQGRAKQQEPSLIFVGNLGYRPNVDGMCWFLEYIWPGLQQAVPGLGVMVAGSEPDERLTELCESDGIELIANPPDLAPLYQQAAAAIVPLRFGSGSRIKILEAGCYGVPVISTFAGAEGLDIDPAQHAFLSDNTADAFMGACLACLGDSKIAHTRAEALQAFTRQHHDRQTIVSQIQAMLQALLPA